MISISCQPVISNLRYPTTFVGPRSKKEEKAKSGLSADSAIDACTTRPTKQTYINVYILPSSQKGYISRKSNQETTAKRVCSRLLSPFKESLLEIINAYVCTQPEAGMDGPVNQPLRRRRGIVAHHPLHPVKLTTTRQAGWLAGKSPTGLGLAASTKLRQNLLHRWSSQYMLGE